MPEVTDAELLRRVTLRDASAFEALFERYKGIAFGLAYRLVGDRELAEDVVQEAFLSVWCGAATFRPERGSARSWILSGVHHRGIDQLRRRRDLPVDDAEMEVIAGAAASREGDPAESAIGLDVQRALASLPDEQRLAVQLAYFGGHTCDEIARALEIPVGTVKGRLRLAMQKLRATLGIGER